MLRENILCDIILGFFLFFFSSLNYNKNKGEFRERTFKKEIDTAESQGNFVLFLVWGPYLAML